MARNLAQLVFLAYAVWLIYRSNRVLQALLLRRMRRETLAKNTRGIANRFGFLRLKKALPPLLYTINLVAVSLFALDLVLQLLLGWFGFMTWPTKILNSLAILACGVLATCTGLIDSQLRFGKVFIWYHWDPDGERIFSSGVLDAVLFALAPVVIVVCNFLAL